MPKIYSIYEVPPKVIDINNEPTMTQQQFKEEANINNIIDKYQRTGFLVDPFINTKGKALYGDFSEVQDFAEAQRLLIESQEAFNRLNPKVRARFNNDSIQFLEFINDEKNLPEAYDLGLVAKRDSSTLDVTVPTDTKPPVT